MEAESSEMQWTNTQTPMIIFNLRAIGQPYRAAVAVASRGSLLAYNLSYIFIIARGQSRHYLGWLGLVQRIACNFESKKGLSSLPLIQLFIFLFIFIYLLSSLFSCAFLIRISLAGDTHTVITRWPLVQHNTAQQSN